MEFELIESLLISNDSFTSLIFLGVTTLYALHVCMYVCIYVCKSMYVYMCVSI